MKQYIYHSSEYFAVMDEPVMLLYCIDYELETVECKAVKIPLYAYAKNPEGDYRMYTTSEMYEKRTFTKVSQRKASGLYTIDNIIRPDVQALIARGIEYGFTAPEQAYLDMADIAPAELAPKSCSKAYIDIEVDTTNGFAKASEADAKITAISYFWAGACYTHFLDKADNSKITILSKNGTRSFKWYKTRYSSEPVMIKSCLAELNKRKVALKTGWNFIKYDLRYIMNRCKRLGIPQELINNGKPIAIEETDESFMSNQMTKVFAEGCDYLDEREVFKKFKRSSLKRTSLGAVSLDHTGLHKVDINLRTATPDEIAFYNAWDAVLCYLIDEAPVAGEKLFEYYEIIRSFSLTPMSEVFSVVRTTTRSMCSFAEMTGRLLRRLKKPDADLKAALTFETEPAKNIDVISFDYKSEYTSAIIAWNISSESLVTDEKEHNRLLAEYKLALDSGTLKNFSHYVAPYLDPATMDSSLAVKPLKYDYRCVRFFSKADSFERDYVKFMQAKRYEIAKKSKQRETAFKVYLNGIYGAKKQRSFFLANVEEAQTITSCGRTEMTALKHCANNSGRRTIAGDTDSSYMRMKKSDSLECAACKGEIRVTNYDTLNSCPYCNKKLKLAAPAIESELISAIRAMLDERYVYEEEWININFENHFKTFITVGVKKRYIGRRLDGTEHIRGFERIKVDTNPITKQAQTFVMNELLSTKSVADTASAIRDYIRALKAKLKTYSYTDLAVIKPLNRSTDGYKSKGKAPAHVQAVLFSLENFGISVEVGEKFYMLEVRRKKKGKYASVSERFSDKRVAFNEENDLPDDFAQYFEPDYGAVFSKFVEKKVDKLANVVGVNVASFHNTTLFEYIKVGV